MNITADELIVELILQDLKHHQLICGLERMSLDVECCYYLGILDLVCRLMKIPEEIEDEISGVYMSCMDRCLEFPVSPLGEALLPLARECHGALKKLVAKREFSKGLMRGIELHQNVKG